MKNQTENRNQKQTTDQKITNEDLYNKISEIVMWLKFDNLDKLKQLLLKELDSEQKKIAFENTDGEKGRTNVAETCGAPAPTIQGWWKRWKKLGILQQSHIHRDRLIKICSIEEVGIDVPKNVIQQTPEALTDKTDTDITEGQ